MTQIGIHVIGAGYGETIVIRFPDGSAGVIDPFCGDRELNAENRAKIHPIIRFLERSPDTPSLRFVALTHPHADHCMGFGHFIEHFTSIIEELWLPANWDERCGRDYLAALLASRKRERTEEQWSADPGTILNELESIQRWLDRHPGRFDFIKSNMGKKLVCGGQSLEFVCHAPDAQAMHEIRKVFSRVLSDVQVDFDSDTVVLSPEKLPADGQWNLLSTVMLLRWRKAQFLFCGDAEKGAWNRILGTSEVPKRPGGAPWRVNYVKIGHHGSHSGLNDRLYVYLAGDTNPIGVLTPFDRIRRSSRLPTEEAVRTYGANLTGTFTTCREKSLHAGRWKPPSEEEPTDLAIRPEELTGVLERYLMEYPFLASALRSASNEELDEWASKNGWPPEILDEIELRPELADVFHRAVRELLPVATHRDTFLVEDRFRVSHYFSDSGELEDSELGEGTGRLANST